MATAQQQLPQQQPLRHSTCNMLHGTRTALAQFANQARQRESVSLLVNVSYGIRIQYEDPEVFLLRQPKCVLLLTAACSSLLTLVRKTSLLEPWCILEILAHVLVSYLLCVSSFFSCGLCPTSLASYRVLFLPECTLHLLLVFVLLPLWPETCMCYFGQEYRQSRRVCSDYLGSFVGGWLNIHTCIYVHTLALKSNATADVAP